MEINVNKQKRINYGYTEINKTGDLIGQDFSD